MGYKQVGEMVGSTTDSAVVEGNSTIVADKTHLANLIATLKSELASANALLKSKEEDCNAAKEQVQRFKGDLGEANQRVTTLEKQCENYRQTVSSMMFNLIYVLEVKMIPWFLVCFHSQIKHLEEHLKTHSDTIQRLEENQSILKSVSLNLLYEERRKLRADFIEQIVFFRFILSANCRISRKATTFPKIDG